MKKIFLILSIIPQLIFSQVAIGKSKASANNSISIEFGTENKGLVLPYIEDKSKITEPGTLIFDTTDNRVKLKIDGNNWFDLTQKDGTSDLDLQKGKIEKENAKVVIGSKESVADGVLVLEENNKAMVLPKVENPETKIVNPAAGMMVYDPQKKLLCIFNGKEWTYWRN
ncbi:MAG: hypothetical protein Q4G16_09555 [Cruoricaptor ignavus]|nr:hypothetical protein [Cruoricaptor ignavus]